MKRVDRFVVAGILVLGTAAGVACGTTGESVEPLKDGGARHTDAKTGPVDAKTGPVDAGRHDVAGDHGDGIDGGRDAKPNPTDAPRDAAADRARDAPHDAICEPDGGVPYIGSCCMIAPGACHLGEVDLCCEQMLLANDTTTYACQPCPMK
jgi:hypothetical protein